MGCRGVIFLRSGLFEAGLTLADMLRFMFGVGASAGCLRIMIGLFGGPPHMDTHGSQALGSKRVSRRVSAHGLRSSLPACIFTRAFSLAGAHVGQAGLHSLAYATVDEHNETLLVMTGKRAVNAKNMTANRSVLRLGAVAGFGPDRAICLHSLACAACRAAPNRGFWEFHIGRSRRAGLVLKICGLSRLTMVLVCTNAAPSSKASTMCVADLDNARHG